MQVQPSVAAGASPAALTPMNPRVVSAIAVVVLLHAALVAFLLTVRNELPSRPLESRSITAELLSPAPAAAPAALRSPAPKPVPPAPHVKPKLEPKPTPAPKTKPEPLPQAAAPSPNAPATPEPAAPTPPAPATAAPAAAAPAGPAIGRETMAIAAPKDVAHLDCSIAKPLYPALSQRRGEAGTAYVHFVVGLTGKIEDIELKKSSGFSRLDDAALSAMHSSACRPYVENGSPVRAAYTQPFTFGFND
ncbi:TonB family protein [Trinickia terrae]|uniref:Protein TonB n=1 Tax=Trinickia terrae TaxID=2571161 RepID=A0A4U1HFL1_9BURK|nr:energy transducer TonB [Trinickia terrae]TKC77984.1 TonB family protein [Trinickia terrae]